ncbi:uncharacterized protein LOC121860377 [Homarus americanus]|uniref:uncharacterized protein LOC121860377 n=1 Tax=Homarus americanus TaxID=6706 RepID=UPI001C472894|nr:uncharacterized protein LOC121860377 [Homarus americanus]
MSHKHDHSDVTQSLKHDAENPEQHALHVWQHYIKAAKAKHIAIIAHSYGGCVTTALFQHKKKEFKKRVFAVAMTDSVHFLPSSDAFTELVKISCNWVCSQKPLDTPVGTHSRDIKRVSSGVTVHEMTSWASFQSIFKFLDKRLNAVKRGGDPGESTTDNAVESTTDNAVESTTDNAGESTTDNAGESTTDNAVESTTDNVGESTTDNAGEPTTDIAVKSTTDNAGESTTDNVGESTTDNAGESTTDDVGESTTDKAGEEENDAPVMNNSSQDGQADGASKSSGGHGDAPANGKRHEHPARRYGGHDMSDDEECKAHGKKKKTNTLS